MAQLIGTYLYTCGIGNTPNRKIEFYGDGSNICGQVSRNQQNVWTYIGDVLESSMTKESTSTMEKLRMIREARNNFVVPQYTQDLPFTQIHYSERVNIIQNLQPTGSYRISMTNNIDPYQIYEKVERLVFVNPS